MKIIKDTKTRAKLKKLNYKLKKNPQIYSVERTRGKKTDRTVSMTLKEAKVKAMTFKKIGYKNIVIKEKITFGDLE